MDGVPAVPAFTPGVSMTPSVDESAARKGPQAAVPASDLVYQEVKARILDHRLEGGTLISEGEIATELQISRTPVREGFVRLQAEGWMTLYPKRGALIRQAGPDEAREVVEARIVVESHAVESIVNAGETAEAAAELRAVTERQRQALAAGDTTEFVALDAAFHHRLVLRAGNSLFVDFFDNLGDRQRRMSTRAVWKSTGNAEAVLAHHEELAQLVEDGDTAAFRDRLTSHLQETHRRYLA